MQDQTPWWKNTRNLLFQATPGSVNLNSVPSPNRAGQVLGNLFSSNTDLPELLNRLFLTAITVGAMLAVLRLGYAGFVYMTTDVWSKKGNAKEIIQSTMFGLLLLLSIWLILNQINPQLLDLTIFKGARPVQIQNTQSTNPGQQSGNFSQWCSNTGFGGFTGMTCFQTLNECNAARSAFSNCVQGRPTP